MATPSALFTASPSVNAQAMAGDGRTARHPGGRGAPARPAACAGCRRPACATAHRLSVGSSARAVAALATTASREDGRGPKAATARPRRGDLPPEPPRGRGPAAGAEPDAAVRAAEVRAEEAERALTELLLRVAKQDALREALHRAALDRDAAAMLHAYGEAAAGDLLLEVEVRWAARTLRQLEAEELRVSREQAPPTSVGSGPSAPAADFSRQQAAAQAESQDAARRRLIAVLIDAPAQSAESLAAAVRDARAAGLAEEELAAAEEHIANCLREEERQMAWRQIEETVARGDFEGLVEVLVQQQCLHFACAPAGAQEKMPSLKALAQLRHAVSQAVRRGDVASLQRLAATASCPLPPAASTPRASGAQAASASADRAAFAGFGAKAVTVRVHSASPPLGGAGRTADAAVGPAEARPGQGPKLGETAELSKLEVLMEKAVKAGDQERVRQLLAQFKAEGHTIDSINALRRRVFARLLALSGCKSSSSGVGPIEKE